jgi:hypothetical protein
LTAADGKDFDATDLKAVTNNFLHSLFSECRVTLNGVPITQLTPNYNYQSKIETVLTYVSDAVDSHLTDSYWFRETGDMLTCDPTATDAKDTGFIIRWNRCKQSKVIQLYRRLHSDLCNVPLYLLPGIRIKIKTYQSQVVFLSEAQRRRA